MHTEECQYVYQRGPDGAAGRSKCVRTKAIVLNASLASNLLGNLHGRATQEAMYGEKKQSGVNIAMAVGDGCTSLGLSVAIS